MIYSLFNLCNIFFFFNKKDVMLEQIFRSTTFVQIQIKH